MIPSDQNENAANMDLAKQQSAKVARESATADIAVSILVHQGPEIMADQSLNFHSFLPHARLVYHVSGSSTTPIEAFREAVCNHPWTEINPQRMRTRWGDMLAPHLLNIRLIAERHPGVKKVAFSSSTDMLLRPGLQNAILKSSAGYDYEFLLSSARDSKIYANATSDPEFDQLRAYIGADSIVWSQIEGSYYPMDFLREFSDLANKFCTTDHCNSGYYREEIILPTCFKALHSSNDNLSYPYILRGKFPYIWADYIGYRYLKSRVTRKILRAAFKHYCGEYWSVKNARKLANGRNRIWNLFREVDGARRFDLKSIYGIKRVTPVLNAPIRNYLRKISNNETRNSNTRQESVKH